MRWIAAAPTGSAGLRVARALHRLGFGGLRLHPVRSRRVLATAGIAYVVGLLIVLVAWSLVLGHPELAPASKPDRPLAASWPKAPSADQIDYYYRASNAEHGNRRPDYTMVLVAAGEVYVGSDPLDALARDIEIPRHRLTVGAFEIDRFEVTNEQYEEFVMATGAAPPVCWGGTAPSRLMLRHPVCGVSFAQAQAFAQWAGKRLPTEAEWMRAARGDSLSVYPWGDADPCGVAAIRDEAPAAVGSHAGDSSVFGLMDMAGNVSEWTGDGFATFDGCPAPRRDGRRRVVKGTGFSGWPEDARCAARTAALADEPAANVGFRCARDAR
jgi:formylglycine-generating enzyme required for sulfatase activity